MRATASRRRARVAYVQPSSNALLPTVFLDRCDHDAVHEALATLPEAAEAREQVLDTIDFLDSLGADAIGGLHLPCEELLLASRAEIRAVTGALAALLYATAGGAGDPSPPG